MDYALVHHFAAKVKEKYVNIIIPSCGYIDQVRNKFQLFLVNNRKVHVNHSVFRSALKDNEYLIDDQASSVSLFNSFQRN